MHRAAAGPTPVCERRKNTVRHSKVGSRALSIAGVVASRWDGAAAPRVCVDCEQPRRSARRETYLVRVPQAVSRRPHPRREAVHIQHHQKATRGGHHDDPLEQRNERPLSDQGIVQDVVDGDRKPYCVELQPGDKVEEFRGWSLPQAIRAGARTLRAKPIDALDRKWLLAAQRAVGADATSRSERDVRQHRAPAAPFDGRVASWAGRVSRLQVIPVADGRCCRQR
eukprot:6817387-Prymnesium_polylepis.1